MVEVNIEKAIGFVNETGDAVLSALVYPIARFAVYYCAAGHLLHLEYSVYF